MHHDLADAPQGVALDVGVVAGDHLQGQVLAAQRIGDATPVGVVPRELAEVVQGDAYRILRKTEKKMESNMSTKNITLSCDWTHWVVRGLEQGYEVPDDLELVGLREPSVVLPELLSMHDAPAVGRC